jgi:ABC-2 type transport system permease protein
MTALLRFELRRRLRDRRTLIFAAVLPTIFFLLFTASATASDTVGGLSVAPYLMVSMATYGAMNALFTGGGLIAAERAVGWNRQLRIAGLGGRSYVLTKGAMAYLAAIPGLVVVFILGAAVKGIHLGAGTWIGAGVSILLGLLPVAVLGVAIGYAARPQQLQPLFGLGSALLALLGGVWAPVETFPRALRDAVQLLPTYWSADAGREVIKGSWLGWHGTAVLLFWTVALGMLASWLYRRDVLRPSGTGE